PRGAAGLDEARQRQVVAKRFRRARDLHDVEERCLLGIQVEDAPVGLLERRDAAAPDMQRDRAHVDDVEQRLDVLGYEIVDVALRILAPDSLGADPVGNETRRIFLEEGLARDAIGVTRQHDRPVFQVGQQPWRDRPVIIDQVPLGVALLGPEYLVEVGELDLFGERGAGSGTLYGHLLVPLPAPRSLFGRVRDRLVVPDALTLWLLTPSLFVL